MASKSLNATKRGCAAAESNIGGGGALVKRWHERAKANDLDTRSRGVFRQRAPTLRVGPQGGRSSQIRDRTVTERGQMLDDLPAAVARIRDDAGESGDLPVEQDDIGQITYCAQLILREKAGGENDSVNSSIVQPLDMSKLHLRPIGDVTDDQ